MNFFKIKETSSQNIAFISIMCAINLIVSLVSSFFPLLSLIIILILPLTSVLVGLFCKSKYHFIYFISTITLCLVATFYNISMTVFYVIPSIVTGLIFAFILKKKYSGIWSIFISSIIQMLLMFSFIPLINFIYDTDFILFIKTSLGLEDSGTFNIIIPSIIFIISLIQITLSYLICHDEISKFGYDQNENVNMLLTSILIIIFSLNIVLFSFYYVSIAYLLLCFNLLLISYILIDLINEKAYKTLIFLLIMALLSVFIFAFIYPLIKDCYQLLLINIFPIIVSIILVLQIIIGKRKLK